MNYYQPMIDYLDKRDSAGSSENLQLPHLPWTNERYIKEYDPKNPIKLYNSEDVKVAAKKYQDSACKNINNFDVKHSYFGCIPTADATKLVRNLPKHSALDAVYKKDIGKTIQDIKDLEMDAYFRYKEGERRLIQEERDYFPLELKRAIKGKSANQIKHILLCDSEKTIRESCERDAQNFRQCYPTGQVRRQARSLSETRPRNFDENEVVKNFNRDVTKTLENVKKEIHNYTHKTEEFMSDARYRLGLINEKLKEQEKMLNTRNWRI